jgi:hypothetical protein
MNTTTTTTPFDNHGLPNVPSRGCPVSAAMFERLLEAARKGGWPAVYVTFAEGETVTDKGGLGAVCERPARRRTLSQWLDKRPDIAALLDTAAQERRDRLLSGLEDEVEKIALGPGDVTQDFDDKGRLKRTRIDRRNKLHALLKLLAAHDPDTYAERRKLDTTVSGQVNHAHAHLSLGNATPGGYVVDLEALHALEPAEQAELMRILTKMEDARMERAALPPGEHHA